jgi:hypothetical protein
MDATASPATFIEVLSTKTDPPLELRSIRFLAAEVSNLQAVGTVLARLNRVLPLPPAVRLAPCGFKISYCPILLQYGHLKRIRRLPDRAQLLVSEAAESGGGAPQLPQNAELDDVKQLIANVAIVSVCVGLHRCCL